MEHLVEALVSAKQAEAEAKAKRIEAEEALIAVLGAKEEGSETHVIGSWRVVVTSKMTRSMDWDAWREVEGEVPLGFRPVKYKAELDLRGLKWLSDNQPETYKTVQKCITTKPAKASVVIKETANG